MAQMLGLAIDFMRSFSVGGVSMWGLVVGAFIAMVAALALGAIVVGLTRGQ